MKKGQTLIGFMVVGAAFLLLGFSNPDLTKDFVAFDQAFIPPLALTNADKLPPSKKAMKRLIETWDSFKNKYYDSNPDDKLWKSDFDRIDDQIMKAKGVIQSGENLMAAHEALEEIRIITLELRTRNNIDYFLDPLTVFHRHMETIFHSVLDKTPEDLSEDDIYALNEEVSDALNVWQKITDYKFDPTLFGFNDEKMSQMKTLISAENKSLEAIKSAIDADDKAAVIATGLKVKPNYAQLYKMFGDFDSLQKQN